MSRKRSVVYQQNDMPDYIAEQLNARLIPAFFPVSFVREENRCIGVYNTGTCRQLALIDTISIKELLGIFCRLMEMIAENEKHYLFGEAYQIDVQTVYVDLLRDRLSLVFQPASQIQSTKGQLCELLSACRDKVSEEGRPYLEDMMQYLKRDEVGLRSAIHHGEVLQNEIYACGIQ